jgi:LysM repeat protein
MRRKPVALVVLGLLALTLAVVGCRRQATDPIETLVPEDEETAMMQEAEQNTEDMEATGTVVPSDEGEADDGEVVQVEATATTAPAADQEAQPTATATTAPQPTATATTQTQPTAVPTTGSGGTAPSVYTVQPGDNLFRIALRFGTTVPALAQANNITNPSLIYVGQQLTIPSGGATPKPPAPGGQCSTVYTVQPGDNLFRIALRYNYNQLYLAQVNGISNPSMIYVGQQICIP